MRQLRSVDAERGHSSDGKPGRVALPLGDGGSSVTVDRVPAGRSICTPYFTRFPVIGGILSCQTSSSSAAPME